MARIFLVKHVLLLTFSNRCLKQKVPNDHMNAQHKSNSIGFEIQKALTVLQSRTLNPFQNISSQQLFSLSLSLSLTLHTATVIISLPICYYYFVLFCGQFEKDLAPCLSMMVQRDTMRVGLYLGAVLVDHYLHEVEAKALGQRFRVPLTISPAIF